MTHSPSELAAFLSLGLSISSAVSIPYFLLVDAESARDFDPRPAVRRAVESGHLDPLLIAVGPALHDARHAAASGLRILLHPAPKGATR